MFLLQSHAHAARTALVRSGDFEEFTQRQVLEVYNRVKHESACVPFASAADAEQALIDAHAALLTRGEVMAPEGGLYPLLNYILVRHEKAIIADVLQKCGSDLSGTCDLDRVLDLYQEEIILKYRAFFETRARRLNLVTNIHAFLQMVLPAGAAALTYSATHDIAQVLRNATTMILANYYFFVQGPFSTKAWERHLFSLPPGTRPSEKGGGKSLGNNSRVSLNASPEESLEWLTQEITASIADGEAASRIRVALRKAYSKLGSKRLMRGLAKAFQKADPETTEGVLYEILIAGTNDRIRKSDEIFKLAIRRLQNAEF